MESSSAAAPARMLVRLPNWLGDLLMARPAVAALRAAHPTTMFEAVAPRALLGLVEWDGVFQAVHAWPRAGAARAQLARTMRSTRPDAALILPPSFSSAWWALRTGARVRVGFRSEARDLLLSDAVVRPPRGELHLADEYLMLARVLGARDAVPSTLAVPLAAREDATALRARLGAGGSYAVLAPGAIYGPAKRWGEDQFIAVGRALADRGDAVLTCGAATERDACERVAEGIGPRAVAVAGHTDLATQAALCAGARVAVCNDSGLAHLSAATGAPTVVVFGSTSSAWTAPLGTRVRVVQHAPPCAPCFQRACTIGYRCLVAVRSRDVIDACAAVAG